MITRKTLWLAIIISLLIGGAAGFAINSIYFQPGNGHFGKTRFISYMTEELDLSALQQRQLDSIITSVHPKFQAIRRTFNANLKNQIDSTQRMIRAILTPKQAVKLDALNKKMQSDTDNK